MTQTRTAPGKCDPLSARTDDSTGSAAQRDRRRRILDAALALASKGGFDARRCASWPSVPGIARVIGDVWLASLVAWVTGRASAGDLAREVEVAVRLLLRG